MGKRAKSSAVPVFHADGGFQVVYLLSRAEAEPLVVRGALDCEYNKITGRQIGYRLAGGTRDKVDGELRSVLLSSAIDAGQMECNAEPAWPFSVKRIDRAAIAVPEESVLARVQAKIFVYPRVGPERGAILAAWPL